MDAKLQTLYFACGSGVTGVLIEDTLTVLAAIDKSCLCYSVGIHNEATLPYCLVFCGERLLCVLVH